jgi:hypothetical protein
VPLAFSVSNVEKDGKDMHVSARVNGPNPGFQHGDIARLNPFLS